MNIIINYSLNKLLSILYGAILISLTSCGSSSNGDTAEKQSPQNASGGSQTATSKNLKIVFFGDSLTEGYTLDQKDAYPNLIQQKINAANNLNQGAAHLVYNLGISGDTSEDGLNRITKAVELTPDIFVLALGTNDSLRGLDLNKFRSNLEKIIETIQSYSTNTKIIIAGFKDLRNRGNAYSQTYENTFKEISQEKGLILIPDLLQGVQGVSSLNMSDKIHPNIEGQKVIAETVWQYLSPLL